MTKGYPDWMRAFLLLGKHDSSYLPVLLGADGSLYAVLQGEYEGALKTVKLDDEGRISAFVIDSVDAWGNLLSIGNTELAARLGSLANYDRRGAMIWADGFENGLTPWEDQAVGTGAAVVMDPSTSYRGGYSCKLTGGSDGAKIALVQKSIQVITLGTMGVQFSFSQETVYDYIETYLFYSSGTQYITWRIRLNPADNTLQYMSAAGTYVTFATWKFADENKCLFHTLKFAVNLETLAYMRCMLDSNTHTFAGEAPDPQAAVDNPRLLVRFSVYSRAGYNDIIRVDDCVITANEI